MTVLFNRAKSLTNAEQNAIAMIVLEESEDEACWKKSVFQIA